MGATSGAVGIHWQVAQATSLVNVAVDMSTTAGNNHVGVNMENGSGGVMTDLVFNGVRQLISYISAPTLIFLFCGRVPLE